MNADTKPHSLTHDALAALAGLGLLAFAYGLIAFAFWLRWDAPIWSAF